MRVFKWLTHCHALNRCPGLTILYVPISRLLRGWKLSYYLVRVKCQVLRMEWVAHQCLISVCIVWHPQRRVSHTIDTSLKLCFVCAVSVDKVRPDKTEERERSWQVSGLLLPKMLGLLQEQPNTLMSPFISFPLFRFTSLSPFVFLPCIHSVSPLSSVPLSSESDYSRAVINLRSNQLLYSSAGRDVPRRSRNQSHQ